MKHFGHDGNESQQIVGQNNSVLKAVEFQGYFLHLEFGGYFSLLKS